MTINKFEAMTAYFLQDYIGKSARNLSLIDFAEKHCLTQETTREQALQLASMYAGAKVDILKNCVVVSAPQIVPLYDLNSTGVQYTPIRHIYFGSFSRDLPYKRVSTDKETYISFNGGTNAEFPSCECSFRLVDGEITGFMDGE